MSLFVSRSVRRAAVVGAVALCATGVTGAGAATTTSLVYRSVTFQSAVPGYDGVVAKGSVRLLLPSNWAVRSTGRTLTMRNVRTTACAFTITAKAQYVLADKGSDTEALVTALTPATGPYLLDEGTRGTVAWRVTRLKTTDGRARLLAVRMASSAITAGSKRPLPAGKQVYMRTTVRAIEDAGDECHTGTYRDSIGPAIGDAMVMQRGRGYLVAG